MLASIRRSAARLAVTVLLVVLAGGAGEDATSTAASQATTTSATVAPTTTVPPMTAEELAWLRAVTRLHKGIDKVIHQSATLTRAKMTSDANTLRACSRELARIGSLATACSRSM